jgi:dUTP pyrophosphatase
MILSADQIRQGVTGIHPLSPSNCVNNTMRICDQVIDPVSSERFQDIEGSAYDLTVGEVRRVKPKGSGPIPRISPEGRITAKTITIPWGSEHDIILAPGASDARFQYLLVTQETISLPPDIMGLIFSKVTLFENGISLQYAPIKPGFSGRLILGAQVTQAVELIRGARIATIVFAVLGPGNTDPYSGKRGGNDPALTGEHPER